MGADFVVRSLVEAFAVIRLGLPLPAGKLPADLLEQALSSVVPADPSVLIGAAIGEDAAALDIQADEVLVLASDPVTLAADSLSRYAVLVNANDVATSGATPRWFIATLLFPPGSTASEIIALTAHIQAVCSRARHLPVRRPHRDHRCGIAAARGGDHGGDGVAGAVDRQAEDAAG